jgi:hypothetical protein
MQIWLKLNKISGTLNDCWQQQNHSLILKMVHFCISMHTQQFFIIDSDVAQQYTLNSLLHFCGNTNKFVLLTVTCSSAIHTQLIVAFPWQHLTVFYYCQWHVTQQYTLNSFLIPHGNSDYMNTPQSTVCIHCLSCCWIFFYIMSHVGWQMVVYEWSPPLLEF